MVVYAPILSLHGLEYILVPTKPRLQKKISMFTK